MTSVADTSLPLDELVAPAPMALALALAIGSDAGAVTDIEVLEHKPGRRALLRYETSALGTVYGKAFPDAARARRTHDVMERIASVFGQDGAALTAPRPLGLVPELGLVLYDPLRGPSLDALAGTDAMVDALGTAGRWITRLHEGGIELDRVLDLEHEAANAGEWSATAVRVFPDLAALSTRLGTAVADSVPAPATTTVPIHKDFHYQHVIVGDGLGVVDVDEARMGDRLFDVGHFLVNLDLLAHRTGVAGAEREGWIASFLESCPVDPRDGDRLRWFSAYTCVKLAKQLATGQGPRPRPPGDERHDQVAWALQHGLALVAS